MNRRDLRSIGRAAIDLAALGPPRHPIERAGYLLVLHGDRAHDVAVGGGELTVAQILEPLAPEPGVAGSCPSWADHLDAADLALERYFESGRTDEQALAEAERYHRLAAQGRAESWRRAALGD